MPAIDDTAYHEVYVYTMGRAGFILQHVVDAQQAQTAVEGGKPIGLVFSRVGLYLHVERGFTGAQVQQAHIQMGRQKREWPVIVLPPHRGAMMASDVMAAPAGPERDAAIDRWCQSVWNAFQGSRDVIVRLVQEYRIV